MDITRRILLADPDDSRRQSIMDAIAHVIAGADISVAKDGSEAIFKLTNAQHVIACLALDLPKRSGIQLTETILKDQRFKGMAVILLAAIPDNEHFVDEVVTGRVQYLADANDSANLERVISRSFNYVSHGDKSEFHLRFLASGEALMREGDKADNVYLLKKGRMRATRQVNGAALTLGHIEVGEFVGEMAYINGEPRSADVFADSACELIEIPVECLDHVLFQKPAWSKALMRTLSQRLRNANESRTNQ